jgi:photosystem II stability/assembly factor-like uncharacterized protein
MIKLRGCLALALAFGSVAQAADPSEFRELTWRLLGPFRGGRVLAVAGAPAESNHFYFGAVNGGVWETQDAGRTWQPIFDSQKVASIGAIAVADSSPNVIYVGTGEADMRSDIAQGSGVYKSTDGGKTWAFTGLGDSQQIGRILVHPGDPNLVYVAALGHPYGPNAERGVFRSRDGGAHWQKVLGKDDDTGAIQLAFQPESPSVIYAALWQTRRPPWNVYPPSSGPGSGLYKTEDGGDHWTQIVEHGFPQHVGRIGIAISAAAPRRVYALVDGEQGGLYRSDDGGANWKQTSGDPRIWQRGWYFGEIAADPKNPDRVYAMNTIVLRSDDGGKTFTALKGDPTGDDFHSLWIDPKDPQRQILGVDQGTLVTLNGGRTWSSWHNQPTAQIYHVSTDNRFPYWVYGAQQDSGAVGLPSRSGDGNGISMMQFHEVTVGGESDNIAADPDDPDIVFGGRVDKLDLRTQQTRSVDPTLALPDLHRGTWTLPLVFSPRQPRILYFANQRLFRTRDQGEHWDAISPDLTRENPAIPKTLDAAAAADNLAQGPRRGVIYSIAPSPRTDGLIWTGTDDGLIWRSDDDGAHWRNVTPGSLGAWSKVAVIDASPFDAESAYAAIDRHRLDDPKAYILRTRDGGRTWQSVVSGLPDQAVNVVRADPVRKGLLYAGTERGIFVSFDDGDHWQPLQRNLPVTSVRDIAIHDPDLIVATHGRGFWILDDIASLRQLDAKVESSPAWLFAPSPAYRVRIPAFTGTPLPKEEPIAANPPNGAYIDYRLKTPATNPVTLEIFAPDGSRVRRYSSADAPKQPDPAKDPAAPEWIHVPSTLAATAGIHRFIWPLHYPAPAQDGKSDPYADGVWAPPGSYRLVLSVQGESFTQLLDVLPDPRVKLSVDVYAQQFALARRVEQMSARVAAASQEAENLLEALKKIGAGARTDLSRDLDHLREGIHAMTGTRPAANPHNAWSFPPRGTHTFRFLNESLEKLLQAVDGADAAPSPDARRGLEATALLVDATLQSWDAFKSRDLAALNSRLQGAGKPVLSTEAPAH